MKNNMTKSKINVPVLTEKQLAEFTDSSYIQKEVVESFGSVLQRYMNETGVEKDMLAKLTGIGATSVHYYLHDEREISTDHLLAVCIALRLHPMRSGYLFSLTHNSLCSNNERDMLCLNYIYACAYSEKFTLDSCNKMLMGKGMKPLTSHKRKDDAEV